MKCIACDVILSDFESTRKEVKYGTFLDMCNRCLVRSDATMETTERYDLYNGEFDAGESEMQNLLPEDQA